MQLIGGNNKEWLPEELKRIVKKTELGDATTLDWAVAEDETLIPAIGKRKPGKKQKAEHSTFAIEQSLSLFGSSGGGSRYRNRKLISPQDIIDTAAPAGGPKTIQHAAPLPLGSLSSFAGGCEKRCNDPKSFHYTATGKDVTVYIVDGVRTCRQPHSVLLLRFAYSDFLTAQLNSRGLPHCTVSSQTERVRCADGGGPRGVQGHGHRRLAHQRGPPLLGLRQGQRGADVRGRSRHARGRARRGLRERRCQGRRDRLWCEPLRAPPVRTPHVCLRLGWACGGAPPTGLSVGAEPKM